MFKKIKGIVEESVTGVHRYKPTLLSLFYSLQKSDSTLCFANKTTSHYFKWDSESTFLHAHHAHLHSFWYGNSTI